MNWIGLKKNLALSKHERIKLIDPLKNNIPIVRQCELLSISRSAYYYEPIPMNPKTITLMNQIDKIYTEFPYYGSPRITAQLNRDGIIVNHKTIERLMQIMGICAIFPRKNTSLADKCHIHYPYLLNGLNINHPNQVWGTDITYIRAKNVWFYLVAILDWYSRYVVAWKLSPSLNVDFCLDVLSEALRVGEPEIHNSDQGSQFTSSAYTQILLDKNIKISMDSRGRCFDNIFTERLWRTVKYEEVYLHDYQSYDESHSSLAKYFCSYNDKRLHQSLGYRPPAEVYFQ